MNRRSLFIYIHIIQQHLYSALVCDFFWGGVPCFVVFFFVHMIQFQTDWTVHIAMWHGYHFTQHVDVEPARHCSSVCLTCNKKMTLNKRGCLQCNHCINFFCSYHSCCSPYVQRVNPNFDDARHTKYSTKSGITFFYWKRSSFIEFPLSVCGCRMGFYTHKNSNEFSVSAMLANTLSFTKFYFTNESHFDDNIGSNWAIWYDFHVCTHFILYKMFEPQFQNGAIQL